MGKTESLSDSLSLMGSFSSILHTSITAQESPCDTAPCVTKNLEGLLARAERMVKTTFVAASVDPKAFGHRHEELGA